MPLASTIQLLQQVIDSQHIKSDQKPAGILPSWRYNPAWLYQRADENLFFTAITAFTLQRLLDRLTPDEQVLARQFIRAAVATYPAFRNGRALDGSALPSDRLGTYNFYPTNPSRHFPHGWLMHRFRHFKLPDDIDDTAMVYLTLTPTPTDLEYLHHKLARHANRTHLTVQGSAYASLRAYSTWFGEQMPIEFDACAMANMLYCVFEYGLPLDRHAQDSLTYLADLILTDRYRTDPFRAAPNYAQTPLIAYHIARLMAAHQPAALMAGRDKFIRDLWELLAQATTRMDRVLLSTSLLRLGERPPQPDLVGVETELDRFSFFIAGMLSAYPSPLLRRLAPRPFWHIRWQCADYGRVLLLEYQVLAREAGLLT